MPKCLGHSLNINQIYIYDGKKSSTHITLKKIKNKQIHIVDYLASIKAYVYKCAIDGKIGARIYIFYIIKVAYGRTYMTWWRLLLSLSLGVRDRNTHARSLDKPTTKTSFACICAKFTYARCVYMRVWRAKRAMHIRRAATQHQHHKLFRGWKQP